MHPHEPASVAVSPCGSEGPVSGPSRTVVWVRGDNDLATSAHLSSILAQAARVDEADITVDLSGVTFMDASTISAIVDAHNRLGARSRSLSVRAPSRLVRQLFAVCGLEFLIEEHRGPPQPRGVSALNSWVEVPATDRVSDSARRPATRQTRSPKPRSAKKVREEVAGSVRQPRAPS